MPDHTGKSRSAKATIAAVARPDVGPLRARHLALGERTVETGAGARRVTVDEAESPLGWLARRRGRDGRALIAPHQLQAGEHLRADFTRGQLMPRTTADWSGAVASDRRGPSKGLADVTDAALAARQRVNAALEAVGPEFSGLLLDLCCFLKRLEDIEQARGWPARSAKVVLQLALDRLARHYGYLAEARGKPHPRLRTRLADDAGFHVE
ncbi:MAG: DNA replication protein [Pseudolabrys sp.]|nr:DNA replication protein [Pseudolabrys sp.]